MTWLDPKYLRLVDGEERAMFGGNLRSRDYVESWPRVTDDGKEENFRLDEYLPYGIHPYFAEHLPTLGCVTVDDVEDKLTHQGGTDIFWDISPFALGAFSETRDFARYLRTCVELGVPIEQILKMVDEAVVRVDDELQQIRR